MDIALLLPAFLPKKQTDVFRNVYHFPLINAYLCGDCNCVSNLSTNCPACASDNILALAPILNREER